MKSVIKFSISLMLTCLSLPAMAGGDGYQKAMENALTQMREAEGMEDLQNVANQFSRIASAETDEWLPLYYAGLTHVYMSFQNGLEADQRDEILEQALELADKADGLSHENAEIMVLQGYITMAKLSVNPAIRGMLLTGKVNSQFGKAMEMDPQNPRAMVMLARMKYGTAQFFNSSTEESCALAEQSLDLFNAEAQNERGIMPSWGKRTAESMMKNCAGN